MCSVTSDAVELEIQGDNGREFEFDVREKIELHWLVGSGCRVCCFANKDGYAGVRKGNVSG